MREVLLNDFAWNTITLKSLQAQTTPEIKTAMELKEMAGRDLYELGRWSELTGC